MSLGLAPEVSRQVSRTFTSDVLLNNLFHRHHPPPIEKPAPAPPKKRLTNEPEPVAPEHPPLLHLRLPLTLNDAFCLKKWICPMHREGVRVGTSETCALRRHPLQLRKFAKALAKVLFLCMGHHYPLAVPDPPPGGSNL